ncbi:redoxin domain-containing protein [Rhizophagus clarus]|uniref:Redoxin domain-containing protein n=1 Tax=Rhizophagus clarus TaxID=94130 RepID=A0A8H3MEI1_9GLOM|nr:redoxin domain-containing protein [Rhizophagus clarus]
MDTTLFPKTVVDIDGRSVDVDVLAKRYVLIFITLKATWCPVCPQLLLILNFHGLKDDCQTSFCDPFDRSITKIPQEEIPFNRLLLRQDAFFIIICPGPVEKVRQIQNDCNFSNFPYHFVVDEDLSLATSINLRMSRNEIWPCIAHIIPETLAVRPVFFGRGPGFYGYRDLLTYLREYRIQVEDNAGKLILKAKKVETRLRKSILTENSVENVQQMQTDQPQQETHREQIFPIELLSSIFEYLEPIEIVKSVTATSRLWRAIGLENLIHLDC